MRDILRYDIDSDRVEKVSSLDVGSNGGVAFGSPDGRSIYYLGGVDTDNSIYKFDTWSNTTQELTQSLPSESAFAAGIEYEGSGYIFDGRDDDMIIKFNLSTETATQNGELPEGTYTSIAAIMDTNEKKVWLFRSSPGSTYSLLEFDLQTNELHSNPTFSPLPYFYMKPATVWDGNYGYIIGGFGEYPGSDGSPPPPTNGILR
jgi:Tol biopolymer transport system component